MSWESVTKILRGKSYMYYHGRLADLHKAMGMNQQKFNRNLREPENMKLKDFANLLEVTHVTDQELLEMFGRK